MLWFSYYGLPSWPRYFRRWEKQLSWENAYLSSEVVAHEPGLDYIFIADNFVGGHDVIFGLRRCRNLLRKENLSFSLGTDILGTIWHRHELIFGWLQSHIDFFELSWNIYCEKKAWGNSSHFWQEKNPPLITPNSGFQFGLTFQPSNNGNN